MYQIVERALWSISYLVFISFVQIWIKSKLAKFWNYKCLKLFESTLFWKYILFWKYTVLKVYTGLKVYTVLKVHLKVHCSESIYCSESIMVYEYTMVWKYIWKIVRWKNIFTVTKTLFKLQEKKQRELDVEYNVEYTNVN